MRLFHFSTWRGQTIYDEKELKPSDNYKVWVGHKLTAVWPRLLFLTPNAHWEPSCQAATTEKYWEKCGSCPRTYSELGIPCWRFEVRQFESLIPFKYVTTQLSNHVLWYDMIIDAERLGSLPQSWMVSTIPMPFHRASKWENNQWIPCND